MAFYSKVGSVRLTPCRIYLTLPYLAVLAYKYRLVAEVPRPN